MKEKIPSVRREQNLCSVLPVTLAHAQPLYRSCLCYYYWQCSLLISANLLASEPSRFLLAFCSTVLMGPKAVPMNEALSLLFSPANNSFQN